MKRLYLEIFIFFYTIFIKLHILFKYSLIDVVVGGQLYFNLVIPILTAFTIENYFHLTHPVAKFLVWSNVGYHIFNTIASCYEITTRILDSCIEFEKEQTK